MSKPTFHKSIGREAAIAMAETEWWVGKPDAEVAKIGLGITELCLPFDVLHRAVEETIGRPVWTHEFGMNPEGIWLEVIGEKDPPTFEEIMNLIPAEKRILVVHE